MSVGPFPECFPYVEVLEIIDILYTNLSKQFDESISLTAKQVVQRFFGVDCVVQW